MAYLRRALAVIDDPILNTPFAEPARHWVLDENGIPTGVAAERRRRSEYVAPVPPPKHTMKDQATLDLEEASGKRRSKRESRASGRHQQAEATTDADLLREVRGIVGLLNSKLQTGDQGAGRGSATRNTLRPHMG